MFIATFTAMLTVMLNANRTKTQMILIIFTTLLIRVVNNRMLVIYNIYIYIAMTALIVLIMLIVLVDKFNHINNVKFIL